MNQATNPKTKPFFKNMTPKQKRWLKFNLLQAGVFSLFGAVCSIIIILFVCLLTLPFRSQLASSDSASSADHILQAEAEASVSDPSFSAEEEVFIPTPTPEPEPQSMTLLAVGDNLIHSTIIEYGHQLDDTYDFTAIYDDLKDEISAADLACIQQETIFIDDPAQYSNYPAFGTPTEMADSLATVGFDVVCHASNHTYDKLDIGVTDTLEKWKTHPEVTVLGIHDSQEAADEITVVERNGIKLALFDFTYGVNYTVPVEEYTIDFMKDSRKDSIAEQITRAASLADMTVVFMHDGNEDSFTASTDQQEWAQFFSDLGVGLIIGTHPHVVEPIEILTGKDGNNTVVYYSLGNFVSSQKDTFNLIGGLANVTITKDTSGTYVSEYSISPVVTLIQMGGYYGACYKFRVLHLEDYTPELAAYHIRSNCSPTDMQAVWNEVFPTVSSSHGVIGQAGTSTPEPSPEPEPSAEPESAAEAASLALAA